MVKCGRGPIVGQSGKTKEKGGSLDLMVVVEICGGGSSVRNSAGEWRRVPAVIGQWSLLTVELNGRREEEWSCIIIGGDGTVAT